MSQPSESQETGLVIVEEKPLTRDESGRLATLEKVISENFLGFVAVGNALVEINEKRLYRTKEGRTFEEYCNEIWEMSKSRAYQLIAAASVVENVHTCGHFDSQKLALENVKNFSHFAPGKINFIAPRNESQARELAKLNPNEQIDVWRSIIDQASQTNSRITAGKVKKAVAEFRGEKLTRAIKQATDPDATGEETGEDQKPQISDAFEAVWVAFWQQVDKERRANWRYTSKAIVYERTLLLLEAFKETGVQIPQDAE